MDFFGSVKDGLLAVKIADFGDAVIAVTAKSIKGSIIVTFDEKFKSALKKLGQEAV